MHGRLLLYKLLLCDFFRYFSFLPPSLLCFLPFSFSSLPPCLSTSTYISPSLCLPLSSLTLYLDHYLYVFTYVLFSLSPVIFSSHLPLSLPRFTSPSIILLFSPSLSSLLRYPPLSYPLPPFSFPLSLSLFPSLMHLHMFHVIPYNCEHGMCALRMYIRLILRSVHTLLQ